MWTQNRRVRFVFLANKKGQPDFTFDFMVAPDKSIAFEREFKNFINDVSKALVTEFLLRQSEIILDSDTNEPYMIIMKIGGPQNVMVNEFQKRNKFADLIVT